MNSRRWSEPALRVSATCGFAGRTRHREGGGPIRWPRDGAAAFAAGGFTVLFRGFPRLGSLTHGYSWANLPGLIAEHGADVNRL